MQKVKFIETHAPQFIGGKNHGMKINAKPDLVMHYFPADKERGERVEVVYNKELRRIPIGSINGWTEFEANEAVKEPKNPHPTSPTKKIQAQVSDPTGHVFAGEGHGVVRDR